MEPYQVENQFTGLRNYVVPVPGSSVTCYLGRFDSDPNQWSYSLWTEDDDLISVDSLDLSGLDVTADQVARVAFLLSVEYDTP